jgi:hypothetical protein
MTVIGISPQISVTSYSHTGFIRNAPSPTKENTCLW